MMLKMPRNRVREPVRESEPSQPAQESGLTKVERTSQQASNESAAANAHLRVVRDYLYEQIDPMKVASMKPEKLQQQINDLIRSICDTHRLQFSAEEERHISQTMFNEMIGIGPIQPLLADDSVNDILVNGAGQVFVERFGKLVLTPIHFIDEEHVFNIAQRIAARVGRRIDETHPMVDARLEDGSRVNIITHPLALDGTTISIRKFMRRNMSLEILADKGAMNEEMITILKRAMKARLNVIISGGTGAGKTTLLNALSQNISNEDRIITIEDAAELQLQQIHVVRLETRPVSAEGAGKVDQRDLVRNALRMRPDRIILGEVRGGESFDMLQAMNTGHDGSLCTVHANTPRDAIMRLENMVMMANMQLPLEAIRRQIASAVDLIVQVERMSDGGRRVVSITEVCGMEDDVIQTQELFGFATQEIDRHGKVIGNYVSSGLQPNFYSSHAHYFREYE